MMKSSAWCFPFGQPVRDVMQSDRTSKSVFVLGVYSSAVHARWLNVQGKSVVTALAVASEPYIFWRGDGAEAIIDQIRVPPNLGRLVPANPQFNGPSGMALDQLILAPLSLDREKVWLCDLVPHSCVNPSQKLAIEKTYAPVARMYGLPEHSVPPLPKTLADESRRKAILAEFIESGATTLILLGDKPIEWFLQYFEKRWRKLQDFGKRDGEYGKPVMVNIDGRDVNLLPLAHPRQIARLGHSSMAWYNLHQSWLQNPPKLAAI